MKSRSLLIYLCKSSSQCMGQHLFGVVLSICHCSEKQNCANSSEMSPSDRSQDLPLGARKSQSSRHAAKRQPENNAKMQYIELICKVILQIALNKTKQNRMVLLKQTPDQLNFPQNCVLFFHVFFFPTEPMHSKGLLPFWHFNRISKYLSI